MGRTLFEGSHGLFFVGRFHFAIEKTDGVLRENFF